MVSEPIILRFVEPIVSPEYYRTTYKYLVSRLRCLVLSVMGFARDPTPTRDTTKLYYVRSANLMLQTDFEVS